MIAGPLAIALVAAPAQVASAQDDELAPVEAAASALSLDLTSVVDEAHSAEAGIELPTSSGDPMLVTGWTGATVAIHLPNSSADIPAEEISSSALPEGVTSYEDPSAATTVIPLVHGDGTVRTTSILSESTAQGRLEFEADWPAGASVSLSEGDVLAHNQSSEMLLIATAPTAVDAEGTPVPTSLEVTSEGFAQVVQHQDGEYAYPIVATQAMAGTLINYFVWHPGNAIEVHVTGAMALASYSSAYSNGWNELVGMQNATRKSVLVNSATYRQQWSCHAAGKTAIGFAGFLGVDPRPAWGLESRGTVSDPMNWVRHQCAW